MDITDIFGNYVMRDQRKDNAYHNKAYTSHEFDDVTGLTYAHARYLATPTHSFLSVDPLNYNLPQSYLQDPQQLNTYSYARNNPVVYTDPNGQCIVEGTEALCGVVMLAAMYAPQIMSFAQSLTTPIGQMGIDYVSSNYQQGNYKTALFGAVTAGEFSGNTAALKAGNNLFKGYSPQVLGKAGEIVGEVANDIKQSVSVDGRIRIPDQINNAQKTIVEVKNVAKQGLTSQIKDDIKLGKTMGYQAVLKIRETAQISKPLQQAVTSGQLKLIPMSVNSLMSTIKKIIGK